MFPVGFIPAELSNNEMYKNARTKVSAMFPVTFAPKGGGKGISPITLLIRIKKNDR